MAAPGFLSHVEPTPAGHELKVKGLGAAAMADSGLSHTVSHILSHHLSQSSGDGQSAEATPAPMLPETWSGMTLSSFKMPLDRRIFLFRHQQAWKAVVPRPSVSNINLVV